MLLGARQFFERRGAPAWTNPYVTNGIVAMWDGEWNAGPGVHDENATTWTDLGPNGYDLLCYDTPSWLDNGISISSKANIFYRNNCSWFRDLWNSQNGVYVEEICLGGAGVCFGFGGQAQTWQSFDFYVYNINSLSKACRLQGLNAVANIRNNIDKFLIRGWANNTTAKIKLADSGVTEGACNYQAYSGNGLALGYRGDMYGSSAFFVGQIFRCAVYNRFLTAAEIAANYAIDKRRFNLP